MANLREIHAQSYSDMDFGEFARRYHQKFYSDMPFEQFASKAGVDAPAVSTSEDVVKSVGGGLFKGAMGAAGAVGDMRDAGPAVTALAASKFGASPETAKTINDVLSIAQRFNPITMLAPTSKQVREAVTPFTGEPYKPQTTAGQFASSAAEFVPGSLLAPGGMVRNVVTGVTAGLGSEAGGQMAKGTSAEPMARIVGALAGGMAPAALSRAVTPLPVNPERMGALRTLEAEGVPLTAGQRTGYKPLQWTESTLGDLPLAGGRAANVQREQGQAFTRAALRRMGEDADLATPTIMQQARERIGGAFDDIAGRANIQMDQRFAREVGDTVSQYIRLSNQGQRPRLPDDIANALVDFSQNQGGRIAGDQLQELRSMLVRHKTADPQLSQFLSNIRRSLDDLVERTAGPVIAQEWRTARGEYRNMKTIERALSGAGENTAQGYISPQALRNAIAGGRERGAYVRGQGDLSELARSGVAAMPQLPQSGTAPRSFVQGLATGGGILSGDPSVAIAGLLGPALAGRTLMSRPVQSYLGNQVMPRLMPHRAMTNRERALAELLRVRPALPVHE